jgi:hypothetical protein
MRTPWLFEIPPIQEEEWEVIPRSPIPRKMVRSPVKPSISVSQACSQLGTPETIDRFGHNRDQVEPFHRIQIIRVAQCVVSSQGSRSPIRLLRIIGHTDPSGAAAYNLQLGQRRADRVKQHLYQAIESLKPGLGKQIQLLVETQGEQSPKDYFIDKKGHRDRCRRFLILQGGSFSGSTLTNRSSVQSRMQDKIASFGKIYLTNFVRQKGLPLSTIPASLPHLPNAARDVAKLFIDQLLACDRTGKLS